MVRARFSVKQIQLEALRIVDEQGLSALTMRALASALSTGPMTLYNYVADRTQLEELVVDAIVGDIRLPPPSGEWTADVTAIARSIWQAVRGHPAAIPLVLTRRSVSAAAFDPAEALIGAMRQAALSDEECLVAFRAVLAFVMGLAQVELTSPLPLLGRRPETSERIRELAEPAHPNVARLAAVRRDTTADAEFEEGLALILAGIEARRAR